VSAAVFHHEVYPAYTGSKGEPQFREITEPCRRDHLASLRTLRNFSVRSAYSSWILTTRGGLTWLRPIGYHGYNPGREAGDRTADRCVKQ